MAEKSYFIGMGNGADSVRSIMLNASAGKTIAAAVYAYPRWENGKCRYSSIPTSAASKCQKTGRLPATVGSPTSRDAMRPAGSCQVRIPMS